jgi:hypothetical protein
VQHPLPTNDPKTQEIGDAAHTTDPGGSDRRARQPSATHAEAAANMQIIRELQDPYRELIRLREAAEIEHELLVQYLHGADSRKPAYDGIRGAAFPVLVHRPPQVAGIAADLDETSSRWLRMTPRASISSCTSRKRNGNW